MNKAHNLLSLYPIAIRGEGKMYGLPIECLCPVIDCVWVAYDIHPPPPLLCWALCASPPPKRQPHGSPPGPNGGLRTWGGISIGNQQAIKHRAKAINRDPIKFPRPQSQ